MRSKIWSLLIVAAVLFGLAGWTGFGQKQRATQQTWEYKVVYVAGVRSLSEKTMNEMGAQGWELITFQPINQEGVTIGAGNYFFKRARTNQP
jgi:hypothetical protein